MKLKDFTRPKQRIFEKAVELFANGSFEIVSMEDIATALDRKKPSIYNHFASKQEILDTALAFFREHFFDAKRPIEAFDPLIAHGSLLEIVQGINFLFVPEYDLLLQRILRIVHQRKYFDPVAQALFQEVVINSSIDYAKDVLDYVVAAGRVAPFDTLSYSTLLNYTRQGTYVRWVLNPTPESYVALMTEETRILAYSLLPLEDLRPLAAKKSAPQSASSLKAGRR